MRRKLKRFHDVFAMSLSAALFFKMYGSWHQTNSELLKFLLYPCEIQIEQYKIAFETWKWSLKIQREITNFHTIIFCLISQLFFLIRKKNITLYLFISERIISKEEKKNIQSFPVSSSYNHRCNLWQVFVLLLQFETKKSLLPNMWLFIF